MVYPVMTVFMPVTDAKRMITVLSATSVTRCLRITDYNPGSRIPAKPPEPTPTSYGPRSGRLSGGAIAGIVVGAVVGAGLLVLALLLWWRRVGKSKHGLAEEPSHTALQEKGAVATAAQSADDATCYELDPESYRKPELPDLESNEPVELAVSADFDRGGDRL